MKFKVGDLVRLKHLDTVPLYYQGKLGFISRIIKDGLINIDVAYEKSKPAYILYLDDVMNDVLWEEDEFELVKSA